MKISLSLSVAILAGGLALAVKGAPAHSATLTAAAQTFALQEALSPTDFTGAFDQVAQAGQGQGLSSGSNRATLEGHPPPPQTENQQPPPFVATPGPPPHAGSPPGPPSHGAPLVVSPRKP